MKRNKHSLSYYKLLSCDMGELIPIGLTEVLPGDTLQHATNLLARLAPLQTPVMHPVEVRVHHWFVPHRLVWDEFEDFITGGPDGLNISTFPTINMTYTAPSTGTNQVGFLPDYLGVPPAINNLAVSALPFRGYAMIYNEFYRDQDLVTPLVIDLTSGLDTTTNVALQYIAWEKDRFTSSRPWEQKGPAITIPLGTEAPIKGIGKFNSTFAAGPQAARESSGTTRNYANYTPIDNASANNIYYAEEGITGTSGTNDFPNIRADLTGVSAVTVNVLREAMALQRYEEARARYGSRYVEYLRYLGVRSSDARLQRPEYLGGGKEMLQFSEVLQTGVDDGDDIGVGNLRGHGIGAMRSNRYRRHFEEHGYIFSLLSVRPKTIYAQGLARTWNRRTKEDFWQQELQHIGQAEVQYKELYAAHATPDGTFGFQDRYDEYRRTESNVAGEFRTTLNDWHFARIFGSDPALNASFITCVPTERTFQVQTEDVLYIMARHSIQARRLVSPVGNSFIY